MFLDKLISKFLKLFQVFFDLVNEPKTRSTRHIFCRSVPKVCVLSYLTSKRSKLESPIMSQMEDNFKGLPMVIYFLMF